LVGGKEVIIGILKEIKTEENRVSMTPAGVEVMVQHGHAGLVERRAGIGSGFEDDAYVKAGAEAVGTPEEIFGRAEMLMHVKEPLPPEYDLTIEGQGLRTLPLLWMRTILCGYETDFSYQSLA
jgi:alanine dehydrogenase